MRTIVDRLAPMPTKTGPTKSGLRLTMGLPLALALAPALAFGTTPGAADARPASATGIGSTSLPPDRFQALKARRPAKRATASGASATSGGAARRPSGWRRSRLPR